MRLSSISVEAYKAALAKRAQAATANILTGCSGLGIPAPMGRENMGLADPGADTVARAFAYARGANSFAWAEVSLKILRRAVSLILWAEDSPQSTLDTHLGLDDTLALPLLAAEARRACELNQPVRTAYLAAAGGVAYQEINRLCRAGRLAKAPHAPKCITAKSASAWLASRDHPTEAAASKPPKGKKAKGAKS